ncbi:hydrolase [Brachybacterium sp. UMB0905]|nr:hydrolase [Brachybacterium sp. UMB0905]
MGGVAVIGAVATTGAVVGSPSAQAQAPVATTIGSRSAAPASPTAAAPSQFVSLKLRYGSRGAAVTYLQKQLNSAGANIAVDGVFGSATLRAVRSHQSSARIGVDGVVGPRTWNALTGSSAPSTRSSSSSTQPKLRPGSRGQAVRTLQSKLNQRGASIAVDGVFGRATESAVRSLQSAAGIGVDAVVGPKTWRALDGNARIGGGSTSTPRTPSASGQPKLRPGSRGDAVRTLQSKLNQRGASIAVDGVFGRGTASAVRSLQSAAGIGVDAVVGPETWRALDSNTRIGSGSSRSGSRPSSPSSFDGQAIVAAARNLIGSRYTWGGTTPGGGMDCSGMVYRAYNDAGFSIPRRNAKGYAFNGRVIPKSEAQAGDLVVFSGNDYGHIGIYVSGNTFIDSAPLMNGVSERQIWNEPHFFVTYR